MFAQTGAVRQEQIVAGEAELSSAATLRHLRPVHRSQETRVPDATDIDQLCIDTIRMLAEGAVQKAKCRHPGTPMSAASTDYTVAGEAASLTAHLSLSNLCRIYDSNRVTIGSNPMPSRELFDEQDDADRHSVLPPSITARVTVEQATPIGWDRYAGRNGKIIGMHSLGTLAPIAAVAQDFGFTPDRVVETAKQAMAAG
jgi:transketolase